MICDSFTEKYSRELSENLRIMISGGLHSEQIYSHRCSHAFISPLKYYLPLLDMNKGQVCIVDSVAGIDMVAYGLYLGVDVIVAVVEDTYNSKKVYGQIKEIADNLDIPIYFLHNKAKTGSKRLKIEDNEALASIYFDEKIADKFAPIFDIIKN